ncbi:MAG: glutamate synthase subunit alpha, partial [Halobacteriales archaeon]|nr:glutamate synthase subunit alpha [Halobacteriales archaeon]
QELRELMAELGFRTVEEMVGRPEFLRQRDEVSHPKARTLDLSSVIATPEGTDDRTKTIEQTHEVDEQLDWDIIEAAEDAISGGDPVDLSLSIANVDRAVGATLSNRISRLHGVEGLPDDSISVDFEGAAGQSFGAFLAPGVTFDLEGVANDYLGKGLSGGKLVIRTPEEASFEPTENTVIGNVALYGATGGEAYINGVAGERFAVRNSGVRTVVEGVGDHGCEYMTSGIAVVLGETGKNFAAGMSGGVAYVWDPDERLEERLNAEMVQLSRDLDPEDEEAIHRLVENHAAYTGSDRAQTLLADWETTRQAFVKLMPDAYREAIAEHPENDARSSLPAPATPSRLAESAD